MVVGPRYGRGIVAYAVVLREWPQSAGQNQIIGELGIRLAEPRGQHVGVSNRKVQQRTQVVKQWK